MSAAEIMMSLEIGLIYGIIATGIYLTFRLIDFPDLTCDGSFVLGAASSCMIIKAGYNPFLALLVSLLSGSAAGIVTGTLNAHLKVTDLLAGILVAFMLYSVNLRIMGGVPNIALIEEDTVYSSASPIVILLIICLIIWITLGFLLSTDFGLALRSIGQNKKLARGGGISIKTMTIVGLAFSNALIALGGALFSQHQNFADVGSGAGTVIVGFASLIIGQRILLSRSIWVQLLSGFIGSILYRLFISLALHSEVLGLETQDLNLITGALVIVVMILPRRSIC